MKLKLVYQTQIAFLSDWCILSAFFLIFLLAGVLLKEHRLHGVKLHLSGNTVLEVMVNA